MSYKYPSNFPIAIILLVLVLAGAIYSLLHKKNPGDEKLQPIPQSVDSILQSDSFKFDLENQFKELENYATVTSGDPGSNAHFSQLNDQTEYSVAFSKNVSEIKGFANHKVVTFSFSIFADKPVKGAQIVYSHTLDDGKDADWQSMELRTDPVSWKKVDYSFSIKDDFRSGKGKIKLYVWNSNKEFFRIDDLEINFK